MVYSRDRNDLFFITNVGKDWCFGAWHSDETGTGLKESSKLFEEAILADLLIWMEIRKKHPKFKLVHGLCNRVDFTEGATVDKILVNSSGVHKVLK